MPLVFVYGTLLSGERNNFLLGRSKLIGEARTEPKFRLVDMGSFPALVLNGSTSVVGEVYDVTTEVLQVIDGLEGNPHWYRRIPIRLTNGVLAYSYVMPAELVEDQPVIESGDWREARGKRSRG